LRAEVKKGTKTGQECEQLMKDGKLVPVEVTLELIKRAMTEAKKTANGFLIDGFPRAVDQAELFQKKVLHTDRSLTTKDKRESAILIACDGSRLGGRGSWSSWSVLKR
jgi:adenylate kinase family enzyme